MKIGFVAPQVYMSEKYYPNRIFGPRMFAKNAVNGLVNRGHEVFFFTSPDVETNATHLIPGEEDLLPGDMIRNVFMQHEVLPLHKSQSAFECMNFYSSDLISKAIELSKKEHFDIIHTNFPLFHFFANLCECPVVFTLHDNLPVEHTLDYWFLSKFYQHNYVSISLNQRKGSIPLNFVGNAYHGIDADKYEFSDGQGEHYAFMGRLMEKKGAHIAIQVTKETNNLLYIASDKLLYDTHYVKEEIFPHVDNKQINLTEFLLTPEQKSKFFKHAKATLFPIMWEEPFGWVMIESMVCGAPVIAYAMGSVPEVIKDGETGFIINSSEDNIRGDWIIKKTGIEGIREAMNRIDNMSREEIARMRQNCREHVKANFSINKVGEQYENIYNRLLSA